MCAFGLAFLVWAGLAWLVHANSIAGICAVFAAALLVVDGLQRWRERCRQTS